MEELKIKYHIFQYPNFWRFPMRLLGLARDLEFFLLIALFIVGSFFVSAWLCAALLTIYPLYILSELYGWRDGILSADDKNIFITGARSISILKTQLIDIDSESNESLRISLYHYGIIELTTKKYDIKIKCRTKEMPELALKIKNMFESEE